MASRRGPTLPLGLSCRMGDGGGGGGNGFIAPNSFIGVLKFSFEKSKASQPPKRVPYFEKHLSGIWLPI